MSGGISDGRRERSLDDVLKTGAAAGQVSISTIKNVIGGIENLERAFIKKPA